MGKDRKTRLAPECTWKTFGALTSEANAEDRVAENIPAVIKGPNPETVLITFGKGKIRIKESH